ncbi:MAG: hypothetical protein JWO13_1733 [Acidobacteriales bacterium]|nr:hypothetical protein [Terriglobales bacterium]
MKQNVWLSLVLVCLAAAPALTQSRQDDYQQGKIVSIKKLPEATTQGDADIAPLKASVSRYNVSTQVGDTTYVYQYEVQSGEGVPWQPGQTQQVRVKGNVIHVKDATGGDGHYSIVSRVKANGQLPQ